MFYNVFMVDLEAYIKELGQDLQVTAFDIKEVQMKLPATKHKWAGRFIRHKQEMFKLQKSRETTRKSLITQCVATAPVRITELAAERVVDTSDSIKHIDEEIQNLKLALELLEKSEKTLSSMTYDIKNMVELMKLEVT